MYITGPDPVTRSLEEYEFHFHNGQFMTIPIDKEMGDLIDFDSHKPLAVMISLVPRPSKVNPEIRLPGEEHTIFLGQVQNIVKRVREEASMTSEQQQLWKDTVQELTKKHGIQ